MAHPAKGNGHDIPSIYTSIARIHERAELLSRAEHVHPSLELKEKLFKRVTFGHGDFGMSRSVVLEPNERLLDHWQELPRRIQDQVLVHLRHYVHSTLGVSWLTKTRPT